MDVILSTGNPSKAQQIRAVFNDSGILVRTLAELGVVGEPVEDGATLEENALIKAHFAHQRAPRGAWAMADDTGIFITALGGAPGVHSARWAGANATTDEITAYCLNSLVGAEDRSAVFRTVVAIIDPDGVERCFVGEVAGHLLDAPRVPPQPKMPYSPLFVPEGSLKVWAEMTIAEENEVSHRGRAFRKAREFLEKFL